MAEIRNNTFNFYSLSKPPSRWIDVWMPPSKRLSKEYVALDRNVYPREEIISILLNKLLQQFVGVN